MNGRLRHFPKSYTNEFPLWSSTSIRNWYFLVTVIKCLMSGTELETTIPATQLDFVVEYRFPVVTKCLHYAKTLLILDRYNNHNLIILRRFQYFSLPLFTVCKFSKLVIKKHHFSHNLIMRSKLDR